MMDAKPPLTVGNSAKLYCLNWIEQHLHQTDQPLTILDLGCGTAKNFVELLNRYPQRARFVGIEPDAAACEAARRLLHDYDATIINAYAYDVYPRLISEQADIIVSFSVFEHVYRRQTYLNSARDSLKPGGHFLINYDAGHFVMPSSLKERAKNVLGPLLAQVGIERYYQRFVKDRDFYAMADQAGFTVIEARAFNTVLKSIYKYIPPEHVPAYMDRWLDTELWLNKVARPYTDAHARTWTTRNFILRRGD